MDRFSVLFFVFTLSNTILPWETIDCNVKIYLRNQEFVGTITMARHKSPAFLLVFSK